MNALVGAALTPPWQRMLLVFGGLLVVVLAAYWPTFQGMVAIWNRSETFAHAFVVPPIVLWLVWRKRAELAQCSPHAVPWMLLPMALLAFVWLFGDLVVANAVTQLAATAMLVMAVPLVLGLGVSRVILFPLAFLFFAVPVGEALTPMLMQWTADFTVLAIRSSGIPVYREGQQFVIPSGSWSVVEACSGIRYLMASFMVGTLFAYLNYRSASRRLIFVIVSIVVPIVANWVRAYVIVMLGHLSNNEIATGADHLIYGWVFFGIVILGMFFIGARWSEPEAAPQAASRGAGSAQTDLSKIWFVALAATMLLTLPQWTLKQLVVPASDFAPGLVLAPTLAPGWSAGMSPVLDGWKPVFVGASVERSQIYVGRQDAVGLHVAYYRGQREGRKLVSSSNVLVSSQDYRWNHLSSGHEPLSLGGQSLKLRSAELLAAVQPGQQVRPLLVVWQYYWIGGRLTSSDVLAKLIGGWQRLSGQGDESAAVLVYAADNPKGSAKPLLERFMRENHELIDERLRQVARAAQ